MDDDKEDYSLWTELESDEKYAPCDSQEPKLYRGSTPYKAAPILLFQQQYGSQCFDKHGVFINNTDNKMKFIHWVTYNSLSNFQEAENEDELEHLTADMAATIFYGYPELKIVTGYRIVNLIYNQILEIYDHKCHRFIHLTSTED